MAWFLTTALSNAAVVALLAGPVWLLTRWARRPALTHALWVLLLVKLVTPPLAVVSLPWEVTIAETALPDWLMQRSDTNRDGAAVPVAQELPVSPEEAVASTSSTDALTAAARSVERPITAETSRWGPYGITPQAGVSAGLGLWLAGSLLLLIRVLRHSWRFRRRLAQSAGSSEALQFEVQRLARLLGLERVPWAVFVDGTISPMLWGAGPCVWLVFPRALWQRLDARERQALLTHELGHFARRDPWVRLLELTCSILFWWHPVVWWARRAIETAGEECCDALVLEWNGTPRTYAEAIVSTLDFLADHPSPLPPLASGISDVPALRRRLAQIMQQTVSPRLSRGPRRAVATLCIATVGVHPCLPRAPAAVQMTAPTSPGPARPVPAITSRTAPNLAPRADNSPQETPDADLPDPPRGWWSQSSPRWAVVIAPDRTTRLVAETGRRVKLESLTGGTDYDLSATAITCAAYLPAGDRFVTGSTTGEIQLWDTRRGESISLLGRADAEVQGLALDPFGRYVVTGSADGVVLVWNLSSGAILGAWTAPNAEAIRAVSCSRDGRTIVAAASDWRSPNGSQVWTLGGDSWQTLASIHVPGSLAAVRCGASPTVRIATWDGRLLDWHPERGTLQWTGHIPPTAVAAAVFSPQEEF